MADENFDILIRILAQQVGTEKAQDILKKVREESTATGKEGVKQQEAVAEATKKTFTSKKQLKDMIKELGHEFPLLGQLGRLALNPIAFSTAAITGAFVLWNHRVQELTRSLGGIEMPDVSTTATDRINTQAEAWGLMAEKMASAANASSAIKTALDAALATIKANEELFTAMGFGGGNLNESRVAAISAAAADLRASGQARVARAGQPGSEAGEAVLAARFGGASSAAMKAKAEAQGRLDEILGLADLSGPRRVWANAKFLGRYGYGMSTEDAANLERGNIASQQGIIDQAGSFAISQKSRAVRRSERAGGLEDIAKADAMGGEVVSLLRQIAAGVAGRAPYPGAPNGVEGLAGFGQEMAKFMANLPALTAAIQRATQDLANLRQRP